jgi:SAM-dependent methyltransferase
MQECVRVFVQTVVAVCEPPGPVLEFGALQIPGLEGFADMRPFFPGRRYIGFDLRPGPGVDVRTDLTRCAVASGRAGTVLCLETLEHCADPAAAVAEMARVLRPDGLLLISVPFAFPIHEYPVDFWRFTPQGLDYLLRTFPDRYVRYPPLKREGLCLSPKAGHHRPSDGRPDCGSSQRR